MNKIPQPPFRTITVCMLILFSLTACDGTGLLQTTPILTSTAIYTDTPTATATLTPTSLPTPTSTRTPTTTATSAPTVTATPRQVSLVISCPGAPEIMLKLQNWAMVNKNPPVPNKVRSQPGISAEVIGNIQPGETMLVESGPRCADGYAWWYVHSFGGMEGWTAEGDAENYWLIPLKPTSSKWESIPDAVTLTASQVASATNIEATINEATAQGTRAGTVILDGREGPFVIGGDDRTINIFVSNLSLIGINQAVIKDCEGGLFFDDFPTKNILVEGIEFNCTVNGVVTSSGIESVVLRNNVFSTRSAPISLGGAISDWLIILNRLETNGLNGIEISGARNKIVIVNNHITSVTGMHMQDCSGAQVRNNILHAYSDGIVLTEESTSNLVQLNQIIGIRRYGIFLTAATGVEGNKILDNTILCRPGGECLPVYAPDNAAKMNTISGNSP